MAKKADRAADKGERITSKDRRGADLKRDDEITVNATITRVVGSERVQLTGQVIGVEETAEAGREICMVLKERKVSLEVAIRIEGDENREILVDVSGYIPQSAMMRVHPSEATKTE
jgi:hypothetical protein